MEGPLYFNPNSPNDSCNDLWINKVLPFLNNVPCFIYYILSLQRSYIHLAIYCNMAGDFKFIATIVNDNRCAKKILDEVPNGSITLPPEANILSVLTVKKYSRDKELFIIYNSDTKENGKRYIAMCGVDNGEEVWRVRKFKLWHTDVEDGFSASRAEPIVNIRGKVGALFISTWVQHPRDLLRFIYIVVSHRVFDGSKICFSLLLTDSQQPLPYNPVCMCKR